MSEEDPADLSGRIIGADRPSAPVEKRLRLQWNVPRGVTPYVPLWLTGVFVALVVFAVVAAWPEKRTCAERTENQEYGLAAEYIGLTEAQAASKAESSGVAFRVACRDGHSQGGTADLVRDRVNVGIDKGRVTIARRY